jgi:hypothetical protein
MNSKKYKFFTQVITLFTLGVFISLILWRVSPYVQPIPDRDSGVFQYIGWRILNGEVPYKDAWDHKPPLIFFINAIGLLIGSGSSWGVWFLEWINLLFATFFSFYLFKRYSGTFFAGIVTLLWLFCVPLLISDGNLTTEFGLSFQFLVLLLFAKFKLNSENKLLSICLGLCTGCLFFLKQTLIGIPLTIFFLVVIYRIFHNQIKIIVSDLIHWLIGSLFIVSLFVFYFQSNGSLGDLWNDAFYYNYFYSISSTTEKIYATQYGIGLLFLPGISFLGLLGWGLACWEIYPKKFKILSEYLDKQIVFFAIFNLPVELILTGISGRIARHYFLPLLPIFSILILISILNIYGILKKIGFKEKIINLIVVIVLFTMPSVFMISGYRNYFIQPTKPILNQALNNSLNLVDYLDSKSDTDDNVLILGAEASINFAASRKAPTRFVYQYPLVKTGFDSSEYEAEFFRDIEQNKPRIIVDATGTNLAFTTGTIGRLVNTYHGQGFNQRVFATDYFHSSCRYDRKFGAWTAYLCQ